MGAQRGSIGLVVVLGLLGVVAAPAAAQPVPEMFRRIVEGCTAQTGGDGTFTCACTAVAMIERCQAMGANNLASLDACIQQNEEAWAVPIVQTCTAYGRLRLGPSVPTLRRRPTPPAGPGVPVMTDVQVWNLFYGGCTRDNPNLAYACGCFSTATVAACMADGSAPAHHVQQCVPEVAPEIEQLAGACATPGGLRYDTGGGAPSMAGSGPMPPAPPSAVGATDPDAQRVCRIAQIADPAQRTSCELIVQAIVRDDVNAFLSTIPSGARVRVGRQANGNAAAVRARIDRDGPLRELFGGPSSEVNVTTGPGGARMVIFNHDIVDRRPPEATFTWDALLGRWILSAM